MTMTNPLVAPQWVQCALCGAVYPFGQAHSHAHTAAAPAPADTPAPDAPAGSPSIEERVAALEQRMDACETWMAQDAMSELDTMAMAAALPGETAAYTVKAQGDQFCVIKEAGGENMGCHPTAADAQAQIDAIMLNEANTTPSA